MMKKANNKTNGNMARMNVTQVLHEDHQRVRELFFKFKECEANSEKEATVQQILTELYVHATVEEEIVYPAVAEEADRSEDLVEEAESEHHIVKYLMAELSNMSPDEERFEAKVTLLCELVEHHVLEEEKEMFKKLRESKADLERLTERVMNRKEQLKADPLPAMQATLLIDQAPDPGEQEKFKTNRHIASRKSRKTA